MARRCRSLAGDCHLVEEQRAREDATAHVDVIAERHDVPVHGLQVSGDGDLVHRVGDRTLLHPEAARAARVIAGDAVHPVAHELRHQEPGAVAPEDGLRIELSLLTYEEADVYSSRVARRFEVNST